MIKDKRILVTGGGGFIGSHLAKKLHEAGNYVKVVDIKWDPYVTQVYCTDKVTADLRDYKECLNATKDIDIVVNLAANMGGIGFISSVGADIMYDNTLINSQMCKASVENKVESIFFSSSACIYPTHKQLDSDIPGLKEDDAYPANPDSFYGWEKLYAELFMQSFKKDYNLNIRIARFHNIYGPEGTFDGGREKSPAALCRKVANVSDSGKIEIWGDGKQTRSYCFIDDCVDGVIKLIESDYDKPLNIGSDRLVAIDELADMIIKLSKKSIIKLYNTSKPQGVRGRNADLTLVKSILGWEPRISLEEGLLRTYKWIDEQLTSNKNEVLTT